MRFLEQAGIPAEIESDDGGGMFPVSTLVSFRVVVAREYGDHAAEILGEARSRPEVRREGLEAAVTGEIDEDGDSAGTRQGHTLVVAAAGLSPAFVATLGVVFSGKANLSGRFDPGMALVAIVMVFGPIVIYAWTMAVLGSLKESSMPLFVAALFPTLFMVLLNVGIFLAAAAIVGPLVGFELEAFEKLLPLD